MKVSRYFRLGLIQSQLDFVDVDPTGDTDLYIDPYALEMKQDAWSASCGDCIRTFFEELLNAIRTDNDQRSQELISHLHEPQETYLGMSKGKPDGKGLAETQGNEILAALKSSKAAETGVLTDLAETSLFIDGIDKDKVSDLTTNVIRGPLVEYTLEQCKIHGITNLKTYGGPPIWNPATTEWEGKVVQLPFIGAAPVLLVPKYAVRKETSLRGREFYDKHMIEFLRAERQAALSLARAIGRQRVTKKETKERHPLNGKNTLVEFAKRYPAVLEEYKQIKSRTRPLRADEFDENFDERKFIEILQGELRNITPGRPDADRYHNFTLGILTFLFHPQLICPIKEADINQGRKRIDIRFTNGLGTPFFERILQAPQTRAQTVIVECKNYNEDIGNEELDQLAGRFSHVRGWFGMLFCRQVDDWNAVNERCRDLARDGHGFIIVCTDDDVHKMLGMIARGERAALDGYLTSKLQALLN